MTARTRSERATWDDGAEQRAGAGDPLRGPDDFGQSTHVHAVLARAVLALNLTHACVEASRPGSFCRSKDAWRPNIAKAEGDRRSMCGVHVHEF